MFGRRKRPGCSIRSNNLLAASPRLTFGAKIDLDPSAMFLWANHSSSLDELLVIWLEELFGSGHFLELFTSSHVGAEGNCRLHPEALAPLPSGLGVVFGAPHSVYTPSLCMQMRGQPHFVGSEE